MNTNLKKEPILSVIILLTDNKQTNSIMQQLFIRGGNDMPISIAVLVLRVASIGMLGFAFVWALAPFDSINTPAIWLIDLLDWPFNGNVTEFNRYEQWFSAVATSFLIGFALLFLLLICPLLEQGNALARRAGLISISVWFIADNIGSYAAGVPVNILWNVFFISPFIIPLMFVKLTQENIS